jgi:molybdate transport system substrate-binding protein
MRAACLLALLIWAVGARPAHANDLTVFAAASLADAFEEVAALHRRQGGDPVRFSFAASSTLARQIELGAPAHIFASADEAWMDYLEARGRIEAKTRSHRLANRLVLVARREAAQPIAILPGMALAARLGPAGRLALGDPDHVPAGRYARQALEHLGLWPELSGRLTRADNVRVALALLTRGEVPLAIVYASDAAATPGVAVVGTFPSESHRPIRYAIAIVAGQDSRAARAFLAFLDGPAALGIYQKHGFLLND